MTAGEQWLQWLQLLPSTHGDGLAVDFFADDLRTMRGFCTVVMAAFATPIIFLSNFGDFCAILVSFFTTLGDFLVTVVDFLTTVCDFFTTVGEFLTAVGTFFTTVGDSLAAAVDLFTTLWAPFLPSVGSALCIYITAQQDCD